MNTNILFLVIDGLRSDKCFGPNKTSLTPNLDSIIEKGIIFPNSICPGFSTIPSMSSIFTSMFPHECLIKDNETYDINPNIENYVSFLKNLGYDTFGYMPESLNVSRIPQLFGENVRTIPTAMTISKGLDKLIIEYFKKIKLKIKWFFYVHIYDLYVELVLNSKESNQDFLNDKKLGENRYERILSNLDSFIGKLFAEVELNNTIVAIFSDHGNDRGAYTSKIEKFVLGLRQPDDFILERKEKINKLTPNFLKPIKRKIGRKYLTGVLKNQKKDKIKEIDAEELSTHQRRLVKNAISGETNLYDDRYKVPLILTGSGFSEHKIIEYQISTIDIFPTIFENIGYPEYNIDSRGRNLIPLIKNNEKIDDFVFIDSIGNSPKSKLSDLIGIRTNDYKYFRKRNNREEEIHLYDLQKDPLEEKNVYKNNSELVEQFEEVLQRLKKDGDFNIKSLDLKTDKESKETEKILSDLGYI